QFVSQIFVTCMRFRPLVAIVVPDSEVLFWWANENHIEHNFDVDSLCANPLVQKAVLKDLQLVADMHGKLRAFEYIQAIHLEGSRFTVENGGMTPSLNLRRIQLTR